MMVELVPRMDARGVRMSWDMALSRLACIFSFSTSKRSCSCFFICVVSDEIITDTESIAANVSGYPEMDMLNCQKGYVNI